MIGFEKPSFLQKRSGLLASAVLILFSLLFPSTLFAANDLDSSVQNKIFSSKNRYQPYFEAGGIKYFNQKSTAAGIYDLFIPLWQNDDRLLFTDLRIFDRSGSSFEGNVHLGYRKLYSDTNQMFGVYGAFDRKKSDEQNIFNQLTFGFEYWRDKFFIGGNIYQPIGKRIQSTKEITSRIEEADDKNITTFQVKDRYYEQTLPGIDAELGYAITDNLTSYVGGYYFAAKDSDTVIGPKIRLVYDYRQPVGRILGVLDGVSIEAGFQHDKPRGNTAYIGVKLKVGLTNFKKNTNLFGFARHMVELVRRDVDIVMAEKKTPARIEKIFKGIRPINPESIILQSIIPDKKSSGKGNSDSGQSPPNSSQTDDKPSSDGAGDSGNDENSYNKDDEAGSSGAGNSGKDQSSSASTGETNQTPAPDPAPAPAPAAAPSAQPPPDLLAAPATPPPPTPAALALVVPAPASALAPAATVQVQAPASENAVVVTPRPPSETSASVLSPKSASIQTTEPSNGEKLVIVAGNGTNLQVNTGNLPMLQDNDRLPQNNASRPYTVEIFSQEWLVSGSYRWIRSAFCFLTSFVDCYWLPQNNPVPHINDPIRVDQNATFLIANLNLIDPSANIFDQNGNSTTKVLVGTPYHNPFQYPYNRYAHSFPDINNSTGYCGLYDLAFLLPSRTADLSTHKEESKNNQTITNAIGASSNSTISTIQPSNTKKAKGLSGWMCGDNLACQAILYGMPTDNLKKPKGLSGWICGDNSACQATLHGIPTGLFMALMSHLKIEDPALLGMGLGLIEELFPPVEFGLEYFILDKAFYGIIVGLEKCTPFLLFSPLAYAACVVPAVLVYSGVSSVAKVLKNAFTYFSIFNTKSVWYQFFSSCAEGTTTGRLISVITSYKAHLLLAGDYSLSKEAHEKLNALVDKGAKFSYTEKALGKCIRDQGKRNTTVVVDYTLGYFNASASESVITAPSTDWNNWIMDQAISVGTGCKNWVVYNAIPLVLTFVSYKYWRYMRQPAIGRGFNGANAYTVFEVRRQ